MKNKGKFATSTRADSSFQQPKRQQRTLPVQLPDIVNMDDIGIMTDDDLLERLRALETDREKVLDANMEAIPWEVESCYIRRELQMRRYRHGEHEAYLNDLERENRDAQRLEDSYPVADLDNSAFMFAEWAPVRPMGSTRPHPFDEPRRRFE